MFLLHNFKGIILSQKYSNMENWASKHDKNKQTEANWNEYIVVICIESGSIATVSDSCKILQQLVFYSHLEEV